MNALRPFADWINRHVGGAGVGCTDHWWRDAKRAIDEVTDAFFTAVSFDAMQPPAYQKLRDLFIDQGLLVNNAGAAPKALGVAEYTALLRTAHACSETSRYRVLPVSETTDVFGRTAQRACMVVRQGTRRDVDFELRGAIFFQYVMQSERWLISAAGWDDHRVGQPWALRPEANEFGH